MTDRIIKGPDIKPNATPDEQNIDTAIHRRFKPLNIKSLPIPPRQAVRNPPEFDK
jgi:hypothetical protein